MFNAKGPNWYIFATRSGSLPIRGSISSLGGDRNRSKINDLRCYTAVIPICARFDAASIAFCMTILQILGCWGMAKVIVVRSLRLPHWME